MMADSEDELIIKCFTQSPNMILYGLPQLPIQDKWALITLMGLCWDRSQTGKTLEEIEGPYKLSLREISNLTGVDYTVLRNKQGKKPREGVLDRLGRFGYVTICEGRPVEEYTGALGREQTYLYIHLRKIWQDNMSFAEEWRVPTNRLTKSNLIVFTVGVVNSHVGVANSSVGIANNHVGLANHTVDAASTNYVLRQSNTKQIIGDNGKTLASNDAASSLFQEELIKKTLRYLQKKETITFLQLEQYLHKYMNTTGKEDLRLVCKNLIVWAQISNEFWQFIFKLQESGIVTFAPTDESLYPKNKKRPQLPVARESVDHEELHWRPMVIKYNKAQ